MPLYEFRCEQNHITGMLYPMNAAPHVGAMTLCVSCGGYAKRLLATSFVNGGTKFGGAFQRQSDALLHPHDARNKPFQSVTEIDAFCKANGIEHVGNSMPPGYKEVRKKREQGLIG